MNLKKNNIYPHITSNQKQQGFSLIEFLIASVLSMIVLVAVGSGYFIARQLNHTAGSRLDVQQDLRNASNLIVRDARMAGSFGCFNMATHTKVNALDRSALSGIPAFQLVSPGGASDNLIPIRIITRDDFTPKNFIPSSDVLVFQYGIGSGSIANPTEEIPANSQIVLSSCNSLVRPVNNELNNVINNNLVHLGNPGSDRRGDISVMQYIVNAYAVGRVGDQTGLFRFQLANDGSWSEPQLLISGVNNMTIKYVYVNNCPKDQSLTETFEFTDTLKTGADAVAPTLIRFTLNNNSINAERKIGAEANNVNVYNIEAAVRGGNTCANRTF
ncbi:MULTISPECIES: PilW family protein [unclassified Neisseria]|uniref:PilW family protein n=1 Tax=unclassified Neisseria TaxID=2623750 RepID=UPI0026656183|nr:MULTISPECIES: prepilin-type N-terminal cleavage/methylation domain-containing protein [unclassified Neisseria]MDO1509147.1 prepilin-type N-terminal cleavage/methylation domain-containing protein [Neisseria sp. MVDL19-042950]MDO1515574.1 prepilin-type N-terminal cleavage/methylation domain-containing protein [Neisseria sp. MVDL18-041461]MDO1562933.1 prepilin-type N-terminal cleavage/methylation domain-containing protein [Neisseria sp. MVDL20-010259]